MDMQLMRILFIIYEFFIAILAGFEGKFSPPDCASCSGVAQ